MAPLWPKSWRRSFSRRRYVHSSAAKQSQGNTSLEEAGALACAIKSRSVIRFKGADVFKFLQGLVTNDVRSIENPPSSSSPTSYLPTVNLPVHQPAPIYAAMLTPQGRFLYDLFLYRPSNPLEKLDKSGSRPGPANHNGDLTVFADVDASVLDELLSFFRKWVGICTTKFLFTN